MGTNFYLNVPEAGNSSPNVHIGKRSAAGYYCHDCGISLANEVVDRWDNKTYYSDDAVHRGSGKDGEFFDVCPICGAKPVKESLEKSSAGKELGFNKSEEKKSGVSTTSSFSFAMRMEEVKNGIDRLERNKIKPVVDEYGQEYSREEFSKVLSNCTIKRFHSVGVEFS